MKRSVLYGILGILATVVIMVGINASQELAQALSTQPGKTTSTNTHDIPSAVDSKDGVAGGSSTSSSGSGESNSESPSEEPRYCGVEDRNADGCEPVSDPVCGWLKPESESCNREGVCVRLFVNACEACLNPNVEYWVHGECPLH